MGKFTYFLSFSLTKVCSYLREINIIYLTFSFTLELDPRILAGGVFYSIFFDEEPNEESKRRGNDFPGLESAKYHAARHFNSSKVLVTDFQGVDFIKQFTPYA
jgi:hypothetical protein